MLAKLDWGGWGLDWGSLIQAWGSSREWGGSGGGGLYKSLIEFISILHCVELLGIENGCLKYRQPIGGMNMNMISSIHGQSMYLIHMTQNLSRNFP